MSYQVLARKWRPKGFHDFVGQSPIIRVLRNALSKEKMPHAFVFAGTRGVGKTSLARILARSIRCEQRVEDNACGHCLSCTDSFSSESLNILEIDGASHNGVEQVRDLIEQSSFLPSSGRYKIIIVDEVHMLSQQAFNALLKTLEEPPAHIKFIFATTEPEKIPDTVMSRCQRFDFSEHTFEDIKTQLSHILNSEGVEYSASSLEQIAREARGSMRDALTLTDQVLNFSLGKKIDHETLNDALGLLSESSLEIIVNAILEGNEEQLKETYWNAISLNLDPLKIAQRVLRSLFDLIHAKPVDERFSESEKIWIYENISRDYVWLQDSPLIPESLALSFLKVCKRRAYYQALPTTSSKEVKKESLPTPKTSAQEVKQEIKPEVKEVEKKQEPISEPQVTPPVETKRETFSWADFLKFLSKKSPLLASNLEQGNSLEEPQWEQRPLHINIGFKPSGEIFYEYLIEKANIDRLKPVVAEYVQTQESQIKLNFQMMEETSKFESTSEQVQRIEVEKKMSMEEEFLAHPSMQSLEEHFKSKVDKVIITNKES